MTVLSKTELDDFVQEKTLERDANSDSRATEIFIASSRALSAV
jgi:hypothetical protein